MWGRAARSLVCRGAWLLSPRERVSRPRSLRAACVTKFPRGGRFVTHAMRTFFPRCPNHAQASHNARTERSRSSAKARTTRSGATPRPDCGDSPLSPPSGTFDLGPAGDERLGVQLAEV